ncbi:MAG: hypothetical protein EZS26_000041 [Candidatus Ordinivivax streblomastigis]|uniref:Curli production assembly/transport component CsgG n=1 Tax=Candidatus Ordinivivax streblomastigis TaxID=2540710 RepID=A0A5M8P5I7_9BACT|nr:MAG: hypothetical protein EZS26_000041 [Candidatus Ordinivivax streblomastigis]
MKKIQLLSLALCCVFAAFGQNGKPKRQIQPEKAKPKIAVYVTSDDEGKLNGFVGDYLVDAIVRSGKYTAIERTYDFLNALANEHEYQRTGAVDDNQISKLGKQFGVALVCVVKVGSLDEDKYLSARLIDVETATVTKSSKPFPFSMADLSEVCEDVTKQLFGSTMARTFGKPKAVGN